MKGRKRASPYLYLDRSFSRYKERLYCTVEAHREPAERERK
jgi:hypothetical protein